MYDQGIYNPSFFWVSSEVPPPCVVQDQVQSKPTHPHQARRLNITYFNLLGLI